MKLRTALVGLVIAGSLTAGFVGVAGAQTNSSSSSAPTEHKFSCDTARDHLARLHTRIDALKDHIANAEARIDQLRKQGHDDRADALAKRVERAKDRLARLEARVDRVQQRIDVRCGNANASTSSGT
jgi:phage shock protein A